VLLIGSNPLPNAVAGRLLTTQGATITLLCSKDSFEVAERLQVWLGKHGLSPRHPKKIEESNPAAIFQGVLEELNCVKADRIGLNYTGGTKAMSVHAYHAVQHWAEKDRRGGRNVETVFSYLNPRKLEMVFDPADPVSGQQGCFEPVALEVKLTLTDLLELHGWTLKIEPNSNPILPESAHVLAETCAVKDSFKAWRQWTTEELRAKCRRPDKDKWLSETKLPNTLNLPQAPSLQGIVQSFKSSLSLTADELSLRHSAFENDAKHFCEWLDGKWLEHHVLDVLNGLACELDLHERLQNIVPNEVEFDVDVIAIRGYQLFALSCSTDDNKGLLKSKLFEAFIRARQLGGDEARVALVCCSDKPEVLEHEMRRDVDPEGRIRVFGRKHLADLSTHLKQWIQDQSKGA
jgi:hypothetical protein